jgi:hypothetical protein
MAQSYDRRGNSGAAYNDIDVEMINEQDPKARQDIIKFKQQKIYELSDYRKSVIYTIILIFKYSYKSR